MNVLVQAIVPSLLGNYCEEKSLRSLSSTWKGDTIEARNIKLKQSVLDAAGLSSFALEHGAIGLLRLTIPGGVLGLRRLQTEPVVVEIEDVHILLKPRKESEAGKPSAKPKDAAEAAQAAIEAELDRKKADLGTDTELFRRRMMELLEAKTGAALGQSANTSSTLVDAIIRNGQLRVKNVHIRYEDATTIPASPFAVGLTLFGFSTAGGAEAGEAAEDSAATASAALSALPRPADDDARGTPAMAAVLSSHLPLPIIEGLQYRMARLDRLALYWDKMEARSGRPLQPGSGLIFCPLVGVGDESLVREALTDGICAPLSSTTDGRILGERLPPHHYMLVPSSPSAQLALNPGMRIMSRDTDKPQPEPFLRTALDLRDVQLGVTQAQYGSVTLLGELLRKESFQAELSAQRRELDRLRAKRGHMPSREAGVFERWKYILVLMQDQRKAIGGGALRWDASRARGAMKSRRQYIDAYRKLLDADAVAMKKALDSSMKSAGSSAVSAESLKGSLDKATADALGKMEVALTLEQVFEFRAIVRAMWQSDVEKDVGKAPGGGVLSWLWGSAPSAAVAQEDQGGSGDAALDTAKVDEQRTFSRAAKSDVPMYKLTTLLRSATLAIAQMHGAPLVCVGLKGVAAVHTTTGRNWSAAVVITDLSMLDNVTRGTAWPSILRKRQLTDCVASELERTSEPSMSVLSVDLEAFPSPGLDLRVRIGSAPLEVVAATEPLRAFAAFLNVQNASQVAAEAAEAAASLQASIAADTYSALAAAPHVDIIARISAPWLVLPADVCDASSARLTLQLGDLCFSSSDAETELALRTAHVQEDAGLYDTMKQASLDRLNSSLVRARDYQTWRLQVTEVCAVLRTQATVEAQAESGEHAIEPIALDVALQTCVQPAARLKNRLRLYGNLPRLAATLSAGLVRHLATVQRTMTHLAHDIAMDAAAAAAADKRNRTVQSQQVLEEEDKPILPRPSIGTPAKPGRSSGKAGVPPIRTPRRTGSTASALTSPGTPRSQPADIDAESLVVNFNVGIVLLRLCDVRHAALRMVTLVRSGNDKDLSKEPPLRISAAGTLPDLVLSLTGLSFGAKLGLSQSNAQFSLVALSVLDNYQRAGVNFAQLLSTSASTGLQGQLIAGVAPLRTCSVVTDGIPHVYVEASLRSSRSRNPPLALPRLQVAARFTGLHVGYNPETVAALQLYGAYLTSLLSQPDSAALLDSAPGLPAPGPTPSPSQTSLAQDPSRLPASPMPVLGGMLTPSQGQGQAVRGAQSAALTETQQASVVDALAAAWCADSGDDLFDPAFQFSPQPGSPAPSLSSLRPVPSMAITLTVSELSLALNKEKHRRRVAIAVLNGVDVQYEDFSPSGGMVVTVGLQDLCMLDTATVSTRYPRLVARDVEDEAARGSGAGTSTVIPRPLLLLIFRSYPSGHESGLDSLLEASLARPRVVYIARVWDEVLDYFIRGVLGTALASASQLAGAAISAASTTRLGLMVKLDSPTVVLPVHARSCRSLSLGIARVSLTNAFGNDVPVPDLPPPPKGTNTTVDTMKIAIDGLRLFSTYLLSDGSTRSNSLSTMDIHDKQDETNLELVITRPLTDAYSPYVPGLRLGLTSPAVRLRCSRQQFTLIMDALSLNIGGEADAVPVLTVKDDEEDAVASIAYADSNAARAKEELAAAPLVPVTGAVVAVPNLIVYVQVPVVSLLLTGNVRGSQTSDTDTGLLCFALQRFGLTHTSLPSGDSSLGLTIGQVVADDVSTAHPLSLLAAAGTADTGTLSEQSELSLHMNMSSTAPVKLGLTINLAGLVVTAAPEPIERLLWFLAAPTIKADITVEAAISGPGAGMASKDDVFVSKASSSAVEQVPDSVLPEKQRTEITFSATKTKFVLPCSASDTTGSRSLALSFAGLLWFDATADGTQMSVGAYLEALQASTGAVPVLLPVGIDAKYKEHSEVKGMDVVRDVTVNAGKVALIVSHAAVMSALQYTARLQASGLTNPAPPDDPYEDKAALLLIHHSTYSQSHSAVVHGTMAAQPPHPPSAGPFASSTAPTPAVLALPRTRDLFNLTWDGLDVAVLDDAPGFFAGTGPAGLRLGAAQDSVRDSPLLQARVQAVNLSGSGTNGVYAANGALEITASVGGRGKIGHPLLMQPWKFTAGLEQKMPAILVSSVLASDPVDVPPVSNVIVDVVSPLVLALLDTDLSTIIEGIGRWTKAVAAATPKAGIDSVGVAQALEIAAVSVPVVVPADATLLFRLSSLHLTVSVPMVRADLYFSGGGESRSGVDASFGRHLVRLYAVNLQLLLDGDSLYSHANTTSIVLATTSSIRISMAGLHLLDISNATSHEGVFGVLMTSFTAPEPQSKLRQLCATIGCTGRDVRSRDLSARGEPLEESEDTAALRALHGIEGTALVQVWLQSIVPAPGLTSVDALRAPLKLPDVDSSIAVDVDSVSVGWNASSMRRLLVWLQSATGTAVLGEDQATMGTKIAPAAALPAKEVSSSSVSVQVRSLVLGLNKETAARRVARAAVAGVALSIHTPRTGSSLLTLDIATVALLDMSGCAVNDELAEGAPIVSTLQGGEGRGRGPKGIMQMTLESGGPGGSQLTLSLSPLRIVYVKPLVDEVLAYLNSDILPVFDSGARRLEDQDAEVVDKATSAGKQMPTQGLWARSDDAAIRATFFGMRISVASSVLEVPAYGGGRSAAQDANKESRALRATFQSLLVTQTLEDAPYALVDAIKAGTSVKNAAGAAASVLRVQLQNLNVEATPSYTGTDCSAAPALPLFSKPSNVALSLTSHALPRLASDTGSVLHIPLPALALSIDPARLRTIRAVLDRNILAAQPEAATPRATCVRSLAYLPQPSTLFDPRATRCGLQVCRRAFPVIAVREWCAVCGRTVCIACVAGQVWDEEASAAKTTCTSCLIRLERHSDAESNAIGAGSGHTPVYTPLGRSAGTGGAPSLAPPFLLQLDAPLLQVGLHGESAIGKNSLQGPFITLDLIGAQYSMRTGRPQSTHAGVGSEDDVDVSIGQTTFLSSCSVWDSRQSFEVLAVHMRQTGTLPSPFSGKAAQLPIGALATILGPNLVSLLPPAVQSGGRAIAASNPTPQLFVSILSKAETGHMRVKAGLFHTDVHPHLPAVSAAAAVLGAYNDVLPSSIGATVTDNENDTARPLLEVPDQAQTRLASLGPVTVRPASPASLLDFSASIHNLRVVLPRFFEVQRTPSLLLQVSGATVSGKSESCAVRPAILAGIRASLLEGHTLPVPAMPVSDIGGGGYSPGLLARGRVQDSISKWSLERGEIGLSYVRLAEDGAAIGMEGEGSGSHSEVATLALVHAYSTVLQTLPSLFLELHPGCVQAEEDSSLALLLAVPKTLLLKRASVQADTSTTSTSLVGADLSSVVDPTGRILLAKPGWVGPGRAVGLYGSSMPKIDSTAVVAVSRPPPPQTSIGLLLGERIQLRVSPSDAMGALAVLQGFMAAIAAPHGESQGGSESVTSRAADKEGSAPDSGRGEEALAPTLGADVQASGGPALSEDDLFEPHDSVGIGGEVATLAASSSGQFQLWHPHDYEVVFPAGIETTKGKTPLSLGLGVQARSYACAQGSGGSSSGVQLLFVHGVQNAASAVAPLLDRQRALAKGGKPSGGVRESDEPGLPSLLFDSGDGTVQERSVTPASCAGAGYLAPADVVLALNGGMSLVGVSPKEAVAQFRMMTGVKIVRLRRLPLQITVEAPLGLALTILSADANPSADAEADDDQTAFAASVSSICLDLAAGSGDRLAPMAISLSPTVGVDLNRLRRTLSSNPASADVLLTASPARRAGSYLPDDILSSVLPPLSLRSAAALSRLHAEAVRDVHVRPACSCFLLRAEVRVALSFRNSESNALEPLLEPWGLITEAAMLDVFTPDAHLAARHASGSGTGRPVQYLNLSATAAEVSISPGLLSALRKLTSDLADASAQIDRPAQDRNGMGGRAVSGLVSPGKMRALSSSTLPWASDLDKAIAPPPPGLPPRAFPYIIRNETGARLAIAVHVPGSRLTRDANVESKPVYSRVETSYDDPPVNPAAMWESGCAPSAVALADDSFRRACTEAEGVILPPGYAIGVSVGATPDAALAIAAADKFFSAADMKQLLILVDAGLSPSAPPIDNPCWSSTPLYRPGVVSLAAPVSVVDAAKGERMLAAVFVHSKVLEGRTVLTLRAQVVLHNHTSMSFRVHAVGRSGGRSLLGMLPSRGSCPVPLSASSTVAVSFEPYVPELGKAQAYGPSGSVILTKPGQGEVQCTPTHAGEMSPLFLRYRARFMKDVKGYPTYLSVTLSPPIILTNALPVRLAYRVASGRENPGLEASLLPGERVEVLQVSGGAGDPSTGPAMSFRLADGEQKMWSPSTPVGLSKDEGRVLRQVSMPCSDRSAAPLNITLEVAARGLHARDSSRAEDPSAACMVFPGSLQVVAFVDAWVINATGLPLAVGHVRERDAPEDSSNVQQCAANGGDRVPTLEEVWEHERHYGLSRWSDPLPTERARWSTQSGVRRGNPEELARAALPPGWQWVAPSWQAGPWDYEVLGFGMYAGRKPGTPPNLHHQDLHIVRRRRWTRMRVFAGAGTAVSGTGDAVYTPPLAGKPGTFPGTTLTAVGAQREAWRMMPAVNGSTLSAGAELGSSPSILPRCVVVCSPPTGCVHLTLPGGVWSEAIGVTPDGGVKTGHEVLLLKGPREVGPAVNGGEGECTFGYDLVAVRSRCPPPFARTYALHVHPRVVVANASCEPLVMRQAGCPASRPLVPGSSPNSHPEVEIPPLTTVPVWWSGVPPAEQPYGDYTRRIQLSPAPLSVGSTIGRLSARGGWSGPIPVICASSSIVLSAPVAVYSPSGVLHDGTPVPRWVRSDMGVAPVGTSVLSVSLNPHPSVPDGSLVIVGRATRPDLPIRVPEEAVPSAVFGPAETQALALEVERACEVIALARSGIIPEPVLARPPVAVINHSSCTLAVMQHSCHAYSANGQALSEAEVGKMAAEMAAFRKAGPLRTAPPSVAGELGLSAARAVMYIPPGSVVPIGLPDPVPALSGDPIVLRFRAIAALASTPVAHRPVGAARLGSVEAGDPILVDLSILEVPLLLPSTSGSTPALRALCVCVLVRMGAGGGREVVVVDAMQDSAHTQQAGGTRVSRSSVESWSAALSRSSPSGLPAPAFVQAAPREAGALADALEFGPGRGPVQAYMERMRRLGRRGSHGTPLLDGRPAHYPSPTSPGFAELGAALDTGPSDPRETLPQSFAVHTWDRATSLNLAGIGVSLTTGGRDVYAPSQLSSWPCELMYACMRGVSLKASVSRSSTRLSLNVEKLQLDDQDITSPQPAVFAIMGSPALSIYADLAVRQSLDGGLLGSLGDPAAGLTGAHVKQLTVGIYPIRIRLTYELVSRIFRLERALAQQMALLISSGVTGASGGSNLASPVAAAAAAEAVSQQMGDPDLPPAIIVADIESHADTGTRAMATMLGSTALTLTTLAGGVGASRTAGDGESGPERDGGVTVACTSAGVAEALLGTTQTGATLLSAPFFADQVDINAILISVGYSRVRSDDVDDVVVTAAIAHLLGCTSSEEGGPGGSDVGATLPPALAFLLGANTGRAQAELVSFTLTRLTLEDAELTAGPRGGKLACATNTVTTLSGLLSNAASRASSDIVRQWATLVASSLSIVSSGVKGLQAVTRGDVAGITTGAMGVGFGVVDGALGAVSSVTSLVSKGAAMVTGDSSEVAMSIPGMRGGGSGGEYTGVVRGVANGALTTVTGVLGGVTGLFTETAKGMQKAAESASRGDAKGFFGNMGMGMGKGLVGVVAKPLAGLAGGASQALQGVASTVKAVHGGVDSTVNAVAEAVTNLPGTPAKAPHAKVSSAVGSPVVDRTRRPRPMYGPRGAVRPYSEQEADMLAGIRALAYKGSFAGQGGQAASILFPVLTEHVRLMADLPPCASDGTPSPFATLLITTGRIIAVRENGSPAAVMPLDEVGSVNYGAGRSAVLVRSKRGPGAMLVLPIDLNADDPVAVAQAMVAAINAAKQDVQ